MRETPGHRKFKEFLEANDISKTDAGKALGVTHSAICGYVAAEMTPLPARRTAIRVWTHGYVEEDDWLSDKERARAGQLAEVRPFESPLEKSPAIEAEDHPLMG